MQTEDATLLESNFRLFDSFRELEKPRRCPNPVVGAAIFGVIVFGVFATLGIRGETFLLALLFGAEGYRYFKG